MNLKIIKRFKDNIRAKLEEYLNRAEQIKEILDKKKKPIKQANGNSSKEEDNDDDKEKSKMMSQLEGAIIESPSVKFSDVAGLEGAKDALEEAVILPIKFPMLFAGDRKPWKVCICY